MVAGIDVLNKQETRNNECVGYWMVNAGFLSFVSVSDFCVLLKICCGLVVHGSFHRSYFLHSEVANIKSVNNFKNSTFVDRVSL